MQTDLIIINDYCDRCHVDPSFIVELEEDGLINVQVIGEERYIPVRNWRNWNVIHIYTTTCPSM